MRRRKDALAPCVSWKRTAEPGRRGRQHDDLQVSVPGIAIAERVVVAHAPERLEPSQQSVRFIVDAGREVERGALGTFVLPVIVARELARLREVVVTASALSVPAGPVRVLEVLAHDREPPETLDRDRHAGGVAQRVLGGSAVEIESVDAAVAEVADEQRVRERSEAVARGAGFLLVGSNR